MTPKYHSIDYRGMTIYYDNGLYYIKTRQEQKYISMNDAKAEVDNIVNALDHSISHIMKLIKANPDEVHKKKSH